MDIYRIPGHTLDGKHFSITIASGPVIIDNQQPTKGNYGLFTLEQIKTMTKNHEVSSTNISIANKHFLGFT
ncbi:MAG: hypothetical protein Q7R96_03830 [Nanoarchaeota archaeon]|nr:hypothetical protein [Nanoarchaeota archaeon]